MTVDQMAEQTANEMKEYGEITYLNGYRVTYPIRAERITYENHLQKVRDGEMTLRELNLMSREVCNKALSINGESS